MYRDLRPDDVRPVQVLVDDVWLDGWLEAYRRDGELWRGWVRWTGGVGVTRVDWFPEDRLRRAD